MNRNRTNSQTSVSSTNSSALYPSNNFISPLIKLERLVYRLNSILSIKLEELNEFELEKHLKLLLEYQREISKLKEIVDENTVIKSGFEYENRMQWIENRTELLNKTIEHVEKKDTEEKHVETETVIISEVVTGDEIVNNISDVSENSTVDINVENTSNSPNLIDEILPPKPETSLSLPKPSKSQPNENEQSLVFSEGIQNEHDTLTNELIATVQLIKRNNLHIQKMVKSDDKIITDATGLLATNSDAMQKEGKNLKSFSKTAWVSFWRMLGILFFVCFTFIFVYIFIRLT